MHIYNCSELLATNIASVGFFHSDTFLDFTGPKTTIRGPCPFIAIPTRLYEIWSGQTEIHRMTDRRTGKPMD